MALSEYINELVPALKPGDTVQKAVDWMEEFKLSHLPVISENDVFLGVVDEDYLLTLNDWSVSFTSLGLLDDRLHVKAEKHIFDVFRFVEERNLDIVPVVDDGVFVGIITMMDLSKIFSEYVSASFEGGVIVLQMKMIDYSLAELARISESNGVKILSSSVLKVDDPYKVDVVLKFNTRDLSAVISAFERHELNVVEKYMNRNIADKTDENLQHFFRYLDI